MSFCSWRPAHVKICLYSDCSPSSRFVFFEASKKTKPRRSQNSELLCSAPAKRCTFLIFFFLSFRHCLVCIATERDILPLFRVCLCRAYNLCLETLKAEFGALFCVLAHGLSFSFLFSAFRLTHMPTERNILPFFRVALYPAYNLCLFILRLEFGALFCVLARRSIC